MLAEGGSAVDAATRHRDHAHARRTGVQRHRLGRLRHRLGRPRRCTASTPPAARPPRGRRSTSAAGAVPARGWNSVTVPGCGLGVGRAARQVRQAAVRAPLSSPAITYGRDGFPGVAHRRRPVGGAGAAVASPSPGFAGGVPARRPGAETRASGSPFPDHAANVGAASRHTSGEPASTRGDLAGQARRRTRRPTAGSLTSRRTWPRTSADWVGPIGSTEPRVHPPRDPAQRAGHGVVALIALGILDALRSARAASPIPPTCAHLQIEAPRSSRSPDAHAYVADPDHHARCGPDRPARRRLPDATAQR